VHERSDGIGGGFCLEGASGDGFFGKGGSDAVLGEQADGGLVECGAELMALVRA
jgi:hypothetical protein